MKKAVVFSLLVFLALGGSALAQLKFGTDFTTSDAIFAVTHVKVQSNMMAYYLEGIQQTWVTGNEVAKSLGQLEDWAIYRNELTDSGDYNLTLVVEYKDLAQYDKGRKEFKQFDEAWRKKMSEEKQREIVKTYPDMRTIVGEYLVRSVTFK